MTAFSLGQARIYLDGKPMHQAFSDVSMTFAEETYRFPDRMPDNIGTSITFGGCWTGGPGWVEGLMRLLPPSPPWSPPARPRTAATYRRDLQGCASILTLDWAAPDVTATDPFDGWFDGPLGVTYGLL